MILLIEAVKAKKEATSTLLDHLCILIPLCRKHCLLLVTSALAGDLYCCCLTKTLGENPVVQGRPIKADGETSRGHNYNSRLASIIARLPMSTTNYE